MLNIPIELIAKAFDGDKDANSQLSDILEESGFARTPAEQYRQFLEETVPKMYMAEFGMVKIGNYSKAIFAKKIYDKLVYMPILMNYMFGKYNEFIDPSIFYDDLNKILDNLF